MAVSGLGNGFTVSVFLAVIVWNSMMITSISEHYAHRIIPVLVTLIHFFFLFFLAARQFAMRVILLHFEWRVDIAHMCSSCFVLFYRVDDIEDNSKLRRGIPGMYMHAFSDSDGRWQCISWPLYNAGHQFNEVGSRVNPSCGISHYNYIRQNLHRYVVFQSMQL